MKKKGSRKGSAEKVTTKKAKPEDQQLLLVVGGFARKLDAIVVVDKASMKKALEFVDGCYAFDKRVKAFMDGDVKKAYELHRSLSGKRKKLLDASKAARKVISDRVVAYETEENRKAAIEQKAEQEKLRKKDEAEREERAQTHEDMNMPGLAEEIRKEEIVVPPPNTVETVAVSSSVATVGRWKGDLDSDQPLARRGCLLALVKHIAETPDLIELVKIDPAAINRFGATFKHNAKVPGLRFWEDLKLERQR